MMLEFLETGKALYVLAAVCALGILSRLMTRNLYRRLMKETDNMTLTKNRYLRDLKQKTENVYRLNQGIHNSRVYLEKQLTSYRFLGMSLSGWAGFGGQMTILCFLLGGAASFGAYWYRCDSYYIVLYGSVGILTGLVTMVADYWANLAERKQQLLNALQDYMENSLFNRLVRETAVAASEDTRRESAKTAGGAGTRDTARTADRRNRTDKAVRAAVYQAGLDEESSGKRSEYGRQGERETQDHDFMAQDLDSLVQAEYVKLDDEAETTEQTGRRRGSTAESQSKAERSRQIETERETEQRRNGRGGKQNPMVSDGRETEGSRRDVDYLKNSLEQIAASRERSRSEGEWIKDLSPDELELVGQILKQYLV